MKKTWHPLLFTLGVAMWLAGCSAGQQPTDAPPLGADAPAAMRVEAAPADGGRRQVLIRFRDRDQLNALAGSGVDLFEDVDHERKTVGASVTARTEPVLKRLGVSYTEDDRASAMGRFPAGYQTVEQGEALWRKNTRRDRRSPDGVDCNRNADDHFHQGTSDAYAQDYRGAAPFSEPETQAIRDLAKQQPFDISLDMHAYGGMVLWPPGYDTSFTADEAAFNRIGGALGKQLGYKAGTIARTIYPSFGDTITWEYNTHKTLAFGAELDCGGFSPAIGEVERQWGKWKSALLYLVSQTGKGTRKGSEPSGPLRGPQGASRKAT